MKHVGTLKIESKRLKLRRFKPGDEKNIFNNWANDDQVTKHLTWPTHKSIDISKKIVSLWIEDYKMLNTYHWGIELKSIGELIGTISVVNIDEENESFEIGYCIGKKYWGKGITSEALKLVIDFLFKSIKPERIYAFHHSDNKASGKVMKKAGMKYEGKLRHYRKKKSGKYIDCDFYSILKSDN